MSDEPTDADGPEPDDATPPDGDKPTGSQADTGTLSPEDALSVAKDARAEAARYRKELRAAQAEIAKMRDETTKVGGDAEARAQAAEARAVEAERRVNGIIRSQGIIAAATKARAIDTDAIEALVTKDLAEDASDDAISAAVDALAKAKPHLFAKAQSGTDPAPGRQPADPKAGAEERRRAREQGGASMFDIVEAQARGGGVALGDPERLVRR